MNKIQSKRLLNVARSLRESPAPKEFRMDMLVHDFVRGADPEGFCGTPACALGHYAARKDLQKLLKVKVSFSNDYTQADVVYAKAPSDAARWLGVSIKDSRVCRHFGITSEEAGLLFDTVGCGGAETPKAAAKYIERFVATKLKSQNRSGGRLIQRNEWTWR